MTQTHQTLSGEKLSALSKALETAVNGVIKAQGITGYQIDAINLKPKPDNVALDGLMPGCHLDCSVSGFPPSVHCSVNCG